MEERTAFTFSLNSWRLLLLLSLWLDWWPLIKLLLMLLITLRRRLVLQRLLIYLVVHSINHLILRRLLREILLLLSGRLRSIGLRDLVCWVLSWLILSWLLGHTCTLCRFRLCLWNIFPLRMEVRRSWSSASSTTFLRCHRCQHFNVLMGMWKLILQTGDLFSQFID